jgi:hypothetical protein
MRTIYIHIHGTTSYGAFGSNVLRKVVGTIRPSLATTSTEHLLIPIDKAPAAAHHFENIYKRALSDDRYFFQWSGILGSDAWDKAATFLGAELQKLINDEPTEIIMLGHSHGVNVARVTAERLKTTRLLKFHVITIATPLSSNPPLLMPDNVKTWLHFYNNIDGVAHMGSRLMHASLLAPVNRRIEDIVEPSNIHVDCIWKSYELKHGFFDTHNEAMDEVPGSIVSTIYNNVIDKTENNPYPEKNDFSMMEFAIAHPCLTSALIGLSVAALIIVSMASLGVAAAISIPSAVGLGV